MNEIPIAQPMTYNAAARQWCYGCGCSGKRSCFTVPDDLLVVPVVGGVHILDGRRHTFTVGYIAVCATTDAASEAVRRGVATRPSAADIGRMSAMRAY
ncbi:MAG: hypothetical protein ACK4JD_10885 [Thermoflexales bacterium]